MKELADIAADHCMTIDLHAELEADNVGELEDLLQHNSSANIVLQHIGWSSTGEDQLTLLEDLMANYSNLYLALKKCEYDSPGSSTCYVDYPSSGPAVVNTDWISLINTYSDRIMIGSDVKYWRSSLTPGQELNFALRDKESQGDQQGSLKLLLDAITTTAKANVEGGTADNLYHLTTPQTCPTFRSAKRIRQCLGRRASQSETVSRNF